jgi:hypothetical protein
MTKFVNNGPGTDHYFPGGHPDSLRVENGQTVDVGDVKVEEQDDCYLVGEGDDVRAWPKSRWKLQGSAAKQKAEPKESTKTQSKDLPAESAKSE